VEDEADAFPLLFWSLRSLEYWPEGPDHSLSVAGEVIDPSRSPRLSPLTLEAEAELRLSDDELALISFSFAFSFSSKPMKIRERASLYAASLS
jgi:hypothetical protein